MKAQGEFAHIATCELGSRRTRTKCLFEGVFSSSRPETAVRAEERIEFELGHCCHPLEDKSR